MVMIECPDCGRKVSSDAALCLGCGRRRKLGPWQKAAFGVALGLLAIGVFAYVWGTLRRATNEPIPDFDRHYKL